MSARKLSPELVEEACELREQGMTCGQIARRFATRGVAISEGAISWHCLVNGADVPRHRRQASRVKPGSVARRGDHVVRRFSESEDRKLLAMEATGESLSTIARALGRKRNSVLGRLATLARREERAL